MLTGEGIIADNTRTRLNEIVGKNNIEMKQIIYFTIILVLVSSCQQIEDVQPIGLAYENVTVVDKVLIDKKEVKDEKIAEFAKGFFEEAKKVKFEPKANYLLSENLDFIETYDDIIDHMALSFGADR